MGFLVYNRLMVKDRMKEIARYRALSEGIRDISSAPSSPVPDFHGFRTDRSHTVIFVLSRGSAVFSTSWRENPDSCEAKAVVRASAGDFVLYLPGEPYIMRSDDPELELSMYLLE